MRAFSVLVAAFLILGPANGAEPLRRRVVQPPRNSACAQAVVVQPIELNWLVLSGDTFFLSDRTFGIKKAPKSGGIPLPVSPKIGLDIPQIAVDETSIYFITVDDATTGSIYSVSKNGGTPKLLATKLAAPIDLALDATSVYWANLGTLMGDDIAADGSIERILKNGTGRQVLADKLSTPSSIALDDADVYFSEVGLGTGNPSAGLRRVSKSGGAVAKLIDDFPLLTVASSGTDVIYSGLRKNAGVFRVPKAGGTPQLLADGLLGLMIVVRDGVVYAFVVDENSNALIVSVPLLGGTLRVLRSADFDSRSIAVDDCAVYYGLELSVQCTPH
ncbi:MAG TPA: DUF5050 domain-containing protein [Thermoanaerobaculia bacterium]|nr:DUF5050 domain-containing protein [Thermoanaerobaculia bacterium]